MIIWVEGWGSGPVPNSESGSKERRLRSLQTQLDLLGNSYRELQQCPFYRSLISTTKPRRSNTSKASLGRTALRSEEHKSELQSLMRISYAVFCLKKKNTTDPSVNTKQ